MSNNDSILFVGIATAVLLCGATAGMAIACTNSDTSMADDSSICKVTLTDASPRRTAKK